VQLNKTVSILIHGPADDRSSTDPLSPDSLELSILEAIGLVDRQGLIIDPVTGVLREAIIAPIVTPEEVQVVSTDPAIDLRALQRSTDLAVAADQAAQ
jgi:hypothetical protein